MSEEYQCARCKEIFQKLPNADAEADAEAFAKFGVRDSTRSPGMLTVCDDCYLAMLEREAAMKDEMRVAIRGYRGPALLFEERQTVTGKPTPEQIAAVMVRYADLINADGGAHTIEIEFLDEPNQNERFFRFGTETCRMVNPVEVGRIFTVRDDKSEKR